MIHVPVPTHLPRGLGWEPLVYGIRLWVGIRKLISSRPSSVIERDSVRYLAVQVALNDLTLISLVWRLSHRRAVLTASSVVLDYTV